MVLQYLLLSIPFSGYKSMYSACVIQYHFSGIYMENVQKNIEKVEQNVYRPKYLLTASTRLFTCSFS